MPVTLCLVSFLKELSRQLTGQGGKHAEYDLKSRRTEQTMTEAPGTPPSAARLLRRLATPAAPTGLESLDPPEAAAPMEDARQRLEAAERLLKRLAAGTPDVDEATIDRI